MRYIKFPSEKEFLKYKLLGMVITFDSKLGVAKLCNEILPKLVAVDTNINKEFSVNFNNSHQEFINFDEETLTLYRLGGYTLDFSNYLRSNISNIEVPRCLDSYLTKIGIDSYYCVRGMRWCYRGEYIGLKARNSKVVYLSLDGKSCVFVKCCTGDLEFGSYLSFLYYYEGRHKDTGNFSIKHLLGTDNFYNALRSDDVIKFFYNFLESVHGN